MPELPETLFGLHLARPLWLLALPPAALLLWRFAQSSRDASGWRRAIDPDLLAVLLIGRSTDDAAARRRMASALGAALLIAIVALAGPAWQRLPAAVEQNNDALVIVLDLSLSMYAEDVAPSRLVRAQQKITDTLRLREEGFTGLVAYAGDAHAAVPLTDDDRTIDNLVAALHPGMMPVLGSNVGQGLEIALELFASAGLSHGHILLITDGIDRIADATRHADPAFPISILGIGTPAGGVIPLAEVNQPGRFLQDERGDLVVARLDVERLERVADITYGRYRTLTLADADLRALLEPRSEAADLIRSDRRFDTWADIGPFLVWLLVPLALLAFRRGVLVVLALAVLLPTDAQAGWWDDLWQRRDVQARDWLNRGEPELARSLFADPEWQAAADYRMGEYANAADRFGIREDATGHYNHGNALAHLGELEAAIAAYDRTLALDPEHEDALHNRALVQRALEDSDGETSDSDNAEQQQDRDSGDNGESRQRRSPDDGDSAGERDEQDERDGGAPGEQREDREAPSNQTEEGAEDAAGAQQQQQPTPEERAAMEQWLRRVPDDPGGLLRRKFEHETKQRLRRGEYQRKVEKIW
ncbi:MAG: VWA domain-containing protein [Pseudomonadota bacterium]